MGEFIAGVVTVAFFYFIYTKIKESRAKKSGRPPGGPGSGPRDLPREDDSIEVHNER